jgi:hypothetical protein
MDAMSDSNVVELRLSGEQQEQASSGKKISEFQIETGEHLAKGQHFSEERVRALSLGLPIH